MGVEQNLRLFMQQIKQTSNKSKYNYLIKQHNQKKHKETTHKNLQWFTETKIMFNPLKLIAQEIPLIKTL